LYGLAYAQFTAEFVLAAAAVIMLARIFGKMQKEDRKKQSAGQTGQNLL
ncbi:MAG: MATE family efflux transporter, partial [Clostridiales bacterium]|nr:MATE family efflux transporter [Clostridiales bacterium]